MKRKLTTVTIAADGTTANVDSEPLNGRRVGVLVDCPALVGTTTLTVTVKDQDGFTLYTKASIPESAKSNYYVDGSSVALNIPISGIANITCTASNTQTAVPAVIPVTLMVDEGL